MVFKKESVKIKAVVGQILKTYSSKKNVTKPSLKILNFHRL